MGLDQFESFGLGLSFAALLKSYEICLELNSYQHRSLPGVMMVFRMPSMNLEMKLDCWSYYMIRWHQTRLEQCDRQI